MSYIEQVKADSDFMLMALATKIASIEGAKASLNELLSHMKSSIEHLNTEQLDGLIG
ncbi:hypothetical protein [Pseudoalteromonas sp. MEBiC 03485]|nr:hypothetical protein [Pseudoalteromonas sp. MEBiC 03485]